jgi:hypothetical protein
MPLQIIGLKMEIGGNNNRLEFASKLGEVISSWVKRGTLVIGALCLIIYANELKHFPEGMQLGEGLAFYLVCVGFTLIYAFYVLISTAIGSVIVYFSITAWQNFSRWHRAKNSIRNDAPLTTNFRPMRDPALLTVAGLAAVPLGFYAYHRTDDAIAYFLTLIALGSVIAIYLSIKRRADHLDVGLFIEHQQEKLAAKKQADAKRALNTLVGFMLFIPFVVGPHKQLLVDSAFTVAQLRKENAVIHVKSPWAERVSSSALKGSKSFLGSEYVEFKGVNVLLRSIGTKVIIELPQPGKLPAANLPIPQDSIYVE